MDLSAVIDDHREALKRIVAGLVAMVEMGLGRRFVLFPRKGAAASGLQQAEEGKSSPALTLPRHLHRAVLKMLRPAESAARRLIIVLARGMVVTLPPRPPRKGKPKRKKKSIFVRDGVGTGVVRRSGAPVHLAHLASAKPAARTLPFPLLDPLPRWDRRPRRTVATSVPRICIIGVTERLAVPVWKPPSSDDPLDAGRLGRRLTALVHALDDLPGQAKRFARWKARRDHALAAGRGHRVAPLRGGRPPGGRLSRYEPGAPRRRNIRDIDELLAHAHALAHYALRPDTS
ncbi:hypothetical protein [Mesorhizobium sp. CN2-181]|uniref:hypothetical protein n=1 Tax=Mesorhizobium yinganensis TaxID=3157707 RepID=UPI0032B7AF33